MGDEMPRIRRATSDEVCEDTLFGGMHTQSEIDASPKTALKRAREHWGEPTATYGPGDWLFRLRCGNIPLRVSICPRGAAFALFGVYAMPPDDEREEIIDKLAEMLTRDDDDDG